MNMLAPGPVIAALALGLGVALVLWLWQEARLRAALARAEERASAGEAREAALREHMESAAEGARAAAAKAEAETAELRETLTAERQRLAERDTRIGTLQTTLEKEREAGAEKLKLLQSVREDMEMRFKALADQSVRTQGETLARANTEKMQALLTPLREHVGKFEAELRQVHQGAARDREHLKAEISQLTRRSEAVSQEAVNLTRALRGDTRQQGAWGEMILTSLLERSGLRAGEEYAVQEHRTDEEGNRYRPDVVVHLPGGRTLVVDSKVTLTAYEEAVNAETDAARDAALARHVAAVRGHIDGLSAKGYHRMEDGTVDYVIMFMPIEGAFSEALRRQGDLTGYALERNVTLATPTTLMMALRTIEHVWAVERRSRNAEEIAERAGRLYDKVAGFVDAMQDVGKRLDQAGKAHSTAMARLSSGSGNVIRQVEQLRELGARNSKRIAVEGTEDAAAALPASDDAEDAPE